MRFEGAHCRFKHMATVVKNFKNISKTLAYRHQSLRCAELFKLPGDPPKKILYRGDVVFPGNSINLGNHEQFDSLSQCFNNFDPEKVVLSTKKISVNGTTYTTDQVISDFAAM